MVRVLFVCLGNICRSPMAEAIFRKKVADAGLSDKIHIDSAGTGHWHIGKPPHKGTRGILDEYKIDYSGMKARQVTKSDFSTFDYVIAMDGENFRNLEMMATEADKNKLKTMLSYHPSTAIIDVPDPYYTGNFIEVYELLEIANDELLKAIRQEQSI
ncbi:MAG TPA: low molecular weight phosphotyrosine protein phosphatase [Bacilli bacterium]|nr:low molecular weight phosphotyrosine protein phosphatase [Bacilli bacterium]